MLTVEQLRRIAQFIGVKGYQSATREKLIDKICSTQLKFDPILIRRGDGKVMVSDKVRLNKYFE